MTILSAQFRCLFFFASLVNIALGSRLRQPHANRRTEAIYMSSSTFDWTLLTPNPRLLSSSELFDFESSFANFFEVEILSSTAFSEIQILALDFDIKDQSVDDDDLRYSINGFLTITYSGEVVNSYSDLLSAAVTTKDLNEMIVLENKFFDLSSQSAHHSFLDRNSPSIIGSTEDGSRRTLIIFIILIGVSCILAITSAALFYQSGCCSSGSKKTYVSSYDIKPMLTQETGDEGSSDDGTSTIGNLGANKHPDEADILPVAITPQRGIDHGYEVDTPFSQRTFESEVSTASTITSRKPLGIVSMNTLNKLFRTPQGKKSESTKALYNVAISDDEYE